MGKTELREWVNMTPTELDAWSSDKRRPRRGRPFIRDLSALLAKGGRDWDDRDRRLAAKIARFVRLETVPNSLWGAEWRKSGYSMRHLVLRNGGHDASKPNSPLHAADQQWLRRHRGAEARR